MSLATLTGDTSTDNEPFQFWETDEAHANNVEHLPDVPRDVSAQPEALPVDPLLSNEQELADAAIVMNQQEANQQEAPAEPRLPDLSTLASNATAQSAPDNAQGMPHDFPAWGDFAAQETLEHQSDSSAGPVRHHRGSLSMSSASMEPPSDGTTDASELLSRSLGDDTSNTSMGSAEFYPVVPKADYTVKNGVRLTSTGKPSRELLSTSGSAVF
jgi:hypothetical protein